MKLTNKLFEKFSDKFREPSDFEIGVLQGLNNKIVYAGTVSPKVKAKRRAANRVARRQRKVNARG